MLFTVDPRILKLDHSTIKSVVSYVKEIPISPFDGARMNNCILNAEYWADTIGGKVVTGYIFSTLGNVLVRFIGHAVVLDDKQLVCVTPVDQDYIMRRGKQFFIPSELAIKNGRLPSYTKSLISNPITERFAELENIISSIKQLHPARESLDCNSTAVSLREEFIEPYNNAINEMRKLIPQVEQLALNSYHRNDICHCGSGKKYKSCCL